ncbi:Purine nucleoside phosphorylase [Paragonimus heterotremus]|uniref:purine-nucleoside phosphorylase n=1 Tax=Paragonimus heterotremus TaxID=100268 RepID=A0A8J4SSY3_9TREM|nr:Purine nucleoside phosphorylase [Paragonimus heterotremus]
MPKNLCASYEAIQKTASFIEDRIKSKPTVGIICGSGLGKLASAVKNPQLIKYEDIPNFPCTNVIGHEGNLIFGELGGKSVMVMQGRFHLYEGYGEEAIIIPIRLMKILGVDTLLVSNAAGGLNRNFKLGDLVIIKDHISLPGLTLKNILIGPNDERFGTRFVATSDAYDVKLRRAFQAIVQQQGHSKIVHEGVYVHIGGPTYESPAENRMLILMGADVVGELLCYMIQEYILVNQSD